MTSTDILAIIGRKDPEEMASTIMALWGHQQFLSLPKKRQKGIQRATEPVVRESWLSPSVKAWEGVMGEGSFPAHGYAAKYLSPLRAAHSDEEIGARLSMYLLELKVKGDLKFASIKRFSETHQMYSPSDLAFPDESAP